MAREPEQELKSPASRRCGAVMASNDLQRKPELALLEMASTAAEVIGSAPVSYGITAQTALQLMAAKDTFDEAIKEAAAAHAAAKALTTAKLEARDQLVSIMSSIGAVMYRTPTVTNQMIERAGYAVHDTHKSAPSVDEPINLLAYPASNGSVKLVWSRNGNKIGTIFNVETRTENGTWTIVASTTKAKATLTGFPSGVTAWFRIRATRDGIASLPSNETSIYHTPAPAFLQVAA